MARTDVRFPHVKVLGGLLVVTALLGVVSCGSAGEKSVSLGSRTSGARQPNAAATTSSPETPETSASSPDVLQAISDPFAKATCMANEGLLAPGGNLVADSNATVSGVLPVLQAMGPNAARIAGLPAKTRLAICVYRRGGAASATNGDETKPATLCPSPFLPIALTPGGPLVAYTIAESGQRMAMPTHPPSFLSPCMTP